MVSDFTSQVSWGIHCRLTFSHALVGWQLKFSKNIANIQSWNNLIQKQMLSQSNGFIQILILGKCLGWLQPALLRQHVKLCAVRSWQLWQTDYPLLSLPKTPRPSRGDNRHRSLFSDRGGWIHWLLKLLWGWHWQKLSINKTWEGCPHGTQLQSESSLSKTLSTMRDSYS